MLESSHMKILSIMISLLQKDLSRALSPKHFLFRDDVIKFNQFATFLFPRNSLITLSLNPILCVFKFLQNLFFVLNNVSKCIFIPFLNILLNILQFFHNSKQSCTFYFNTPPLLYESPGLDGESTFSQT